MTPWPPVAIFFSSNKSKINIRENTKDFHKCGELAFYGKVVVIVKKVHLD